MKKHLYIFTLLIIVSFVLTACTTKVGNNEATSQDNGQKDSTKVEDEEENISASVFDLAKLGKNVKCTFKAETDDGITNGETYVAGDKTRSNVKIKMADGNEVDSYTITDGDWMYIWTGQSEQGTKMNIKEIMDEAEEINDEVTPSEEPAQYNDQNQKVDYKCSPWIVDNSKFEVPENINFIDMGDMMKGLLEMSEKMGN